MLVQDREYLDDVSLEHEINCVRKSAHQYTPHRTILLLVCLGRFNRFFDGRVEFQNKFDAEPGLLRLVPAGRRVGVSDSTRMNAQ